MSSINFTVTATEAEFNNFADRLGYQTALGRDENGDIIPNPETRTEYLQRILKEEVSRVFYTPFVRDIDTQVNTARDAEKETMRNVVRDRVTVGFSA